MERSSGHLLASSRLAFDEHVEVGRSEPCKTGEDLTHGGALPIHAVELARSEHGNLHCVRPDDLEAMGPTVRINASENLGAGGAVYMPPIKVRDFTFSSLSDAV